MNDAVRFRASKSQSEVTREWDSIAPSRDRQIAATADASLSEVLHPWILRRLQGAVSIADVGCGTGRLTAQLRENAERVIGIDPSHRSIEIARSHDASGDYAVATVEDWVASNPESRTDLVVANMVLMDVIDLGAACKAVSRLARNGRVLATMTHPAFWPFYWGYATNEGFSYSDEVVVEAPFRTRDRSFPMTTTHFHRPLSMYFDALAVNGMRITEFEELRGPEALSTFPFPRFIGIEATVSG